jgi:alpha-L-arabinofuranosidase
MIYTLLLLSLTMVSSRPIPNTVKYGLATYNYADADSKRADNFISFADVVNSMSPGMMRFPSGSESSSYLWATAPEWVPSSHAPAFNTKARWPNSDSTIVDNNNEFVDAVNFDEFMLLAKGRDVVITVNFDSMYAENGPSKDLLIETARQWVAYSKRMGYNVSYWEIGNESDMISTFNGRPSNGGQYARDFIDFAVAMRAEDDSILIGMNGYYETFMLDVFNVAGEHVDFVSIHSFPIYGFENRYDDFLNGGGYHYDTYNRFLSAVYNSTMSQDKKDGIFVIVSETSSVDWAYINNDRPGWPGNTAGHMITLFDILGRIGEMKRVRGGILAWASHWHDERDGHDTFSMFDSYNQYKPTAYALWLWASLGEVEYVWREETDDVIKFMARTTTGEKILIANKRNTPQDVKISLAFHADSSDSTVIHKTVDSNVLPAYSIAVL